MILQYILFTKNELASHLFAFQFTTNNYREREREREREPMGT
jgi:hypothetical protein